MGWAERCNPRSEWNRKRLGSTVAPMSGQTTDKKVVAMNPERDEPIVIQITPKSIWLLFKEFLWQTLKGLRRPRQSRAPTS